MINVYHEHANIAAFKTPMISEMFNTPANINRETLEFGLYQIFSYNNSIITDYFGNIGLWVYEC